VRRKTIAKSTTYKSYPQNPQLPVDNWSIFRWGEGGRSVGDNCGYIRPTEKAKIGKGAKPPLSRYEKKKTINTQFAIVRFYHAHKDKDNREDRTD